MPHQEQKIQQAPEENKKSRPEKQSVRGQRSYSMPNSLAGAVPMTPLPGMPNSVMREMDPEDSGVLFRGRGFDSSVGAHELSHTVRRQPAPAPVTRTVPSGTIQRDPDNEDEGAAAAEVPEGYEGLSLEEQLERTLSRSANIKMFFEGQEQMVHWRARQLTAEAASESDPDIEQEIRDFAERLDNAIPTLDQIIKDLTKARENLKTNPGDADLKSIRRLVIDATKSQREHVRLFTKFSRLPAGDTNMAAHLHEIKDEIDDFQEVEDDLSDKKDPNFGFEFVGEKPETTPAGAAAATPGAYDEEPAAAAAAPEETAKPSWFQQFRGLFHRKKKDEEDSKKK